MSCTAKPAQCVLRHCHSSHHSVVRMSLYYSQPICINHKVGKCQFILEFCVSFLKFGDLIALYVSSIDSMLVPVRQQCTAVLFMLNQSQVTVEKQTYLDSNKGGPSPGTWWVSSFFSLLYCLMRVKGDLCCLTRQGRKSD